MSEDVGEDATVLNVFLNCELTKCSETKQLHFESLPTTPLDIKKKVEEAFSIPSCAQTLCYQSMVLKDTEKFQATHFRSGDTFTINYETRGDCEKVQNVIQWLGEICVHLSALSDKEKDTSGESCLEINELILSGGESGTTKDLYYNLFHSGPSENVNRLHFFHEGGLDLLMRVYCLLVSKDWGELGIDAECHHYLEHCCVRSLVNYAASYPLCRQVLRLGGMDMCLKTLLRNKVDRNRDSEIQHDINSVYATIGFAQNVLCNLSELPECQLLLAMRSDAIDQMISLAFLSVTVINTAELLALFILNLAQSPQTHLHLVEPKIVEGLLNVCALKCKQNSEQPPAQGQAHQYDPRAAKALQGYISIALAQIGLGSPNLYTSMPSDLQRQVSNLMSVMLETSPAEISQFEEKDGTVWPTVIPYMRFLYTPLRSKGTITSTEKTCSGNLHLHVQCCNVLLHGLEIVLCRDVHLEVLIDEGLLGYCMCLSAVLPKECMPGARSLVNELGRHRQLQPVSLCTLAKAHIAKSFCGLDAVMEMHSIREFYNRYLS